MLARRGSSCAWNMFMKDGMAFSEQTGVRW